MDNMFICMYVTIVILTSMVVVMVCMRSSQISREEKREMEERMKKFDKIRANVLKTIQIENEGIRRRHQHLIENEGTLKYERLRRQLLRDIEMRGK